MALVIVSLLMQMVLSPTSTRGTAVLKIRSPIKLLTYRAGSQMKRQ